MEKLIQEMLQAGIIRDCTSSFASPIHIIEDKFLIPIIEELLDELGEARVFFELDLRSGYHQIRMWELDVHKTAFRTHEGHYEFLVMPFGLTNAPSSFQALMSSIFKPLLKKFVLVFFDDILVYSTSWAEHLYHLRSVLLILREQQLYAKQSKCCFGSSQIQYLGHVLHAGTVSMDTTKVDCISSWPTPRSARELCSFLGLSGYYRRFIRDYEAFQALKRALTTAPVLALPKFQLEFTVNTDASGFGIGAVLQQQGRPVAFFSKALGVRHQAFSIYEKEILAVLLAVRKWHAYLRKCWATILRSLTDEGLTIGRGYSLPSTPVGVWSILSNVSYFSHFKPFGIGATILCGDAKLEKLIKTFYSSNFRIQNIRGTGLTTDVKQWIRECVVCQKCKSETVASPGLLQSLPIPERAWSVVSLNFIEGLPNSSRKNSIFVVVDHLTKYGHFLALSHPYTTKDVAQEYLNHIYKLHGMPDSIISDWDKIFISSFWQELFRRAGTKLLLSTAYHPQTDGQTEWLPLAEWWYNSSYHSVIQLTLYEALYGQPPPTHMPYLAGASSVAVVDRSLQAREVARKLLQFCLKRAQTRMKHFADKHRSERSFQVVIQKVGEVAYTLQLPQESRIHPTFHVSQLKKHVGVRTDSSSLTIGRCSWCFTEGTGENSRQEDSQDREPGHYKGVGQMGRFFS
ncbi:hypothetical protein CXB51_003487 [Gossypium anomalum]|uniref:Uncharacterized protein n=1 Tax=Gossypium anomalum TaxID=47600 RepID=A0A8J5Z613_9ROSI|nr:hypothetical protein CXB51_003487 [Gossypium anomalum]